MRAGELDRGIALERAIITTNEYGEEIQSWVTMANVSASRRRASARETLAASEVSSEVTDVFEIRYALAWSDLNPTDRLIFEGRTYNIAAVDEIGRRRGLRISAAARAE